MTFNDFWHISEMPGVVIGDDMWNLIASLALRAPWEREASSPTLRAATSTFFGWYVWFRAPRSVASRRCNAQRVKSTSLLYARCPQKSIDPMHTSSCIVLIIYHLISFIMTFHDLLVISMISYDL